MVFRLGKNEPAEYIILTVLSVVLFLLQSFFFLFTIPLQVLFLRRGLKVFLVSGACVLASIFAISLLTSRNIGGTVPAASVVVLVTAVSAALVAGLFFSNIEWRFSIAGIRVRKTWVKMLAVTAGLAAAAGLVLYIVDRGRSATLLFREGMRSFSYFYLDFLAEGNGVSAVDLEAVSGVLGDIVLRSIGFSFFLILAFCWRAAAGIFRRLERIPPMSLIGFTLPEKMVWLIIASVAGLLLSVFTEMGFIEYLLWNLFEIVVFLYLLQGTGILKHLLINRLIPFPVRIIVTAAAVAAIFISSIRLIVIFLLPLLGVTETWIKFRTMQRSENHEGHIE